MSITAARDEIRGRRQLVVASRNPWCWKVLSTDGNRHHLLGWDQALRDVVCETCTAAYGQNRCWARAHCLDFLRSEMGRRHQEASA